MAVSDSAGQGAVCPAAAPAEALDVYATERERQARCRLRRICSVVPPLYRLRTTDWDT